MKHTGCVLVTNNPLVKKKMQGRFPVCFVYGGYRDVLIRVRDMIYLGHSLYTHPLAGSVKPNLTPYRTVAVSEKTNEFSMEYSEIISNSIAVCDKFPMAGRTIKDSILTDMQRVDLSLISEAMGERMQV